jgi:lipopolysaccharide transport system ATP-binding protein
MKPSLELNHVSKRYRIGRGFTSLRSMLSGRGDTRLQHFHWAVRDVSFKLRPGEALGIIGPNGAGKTTILKLLSYVTKPTSGEIKVNGRMSALIELGAGFHPDLTGRENIFLNGTILNMSRAEIKERFEAIVDFAGIGDYLDTPVKRYSSGMYARLGFAIAAHVDPQILLVDEVLAVGDFAFQTKCYARMDKLRQQGTSLIFVSHNMDAVRRVCDRGLVMYRGENIFQGSAAEAVVAYSDAIREAARQSQVEVPLDGGMSQRVMKFGAEIENVDLLNSEGDPTSIFESSSEVRLAIDFVFHQNVDHPIISFFIRTSDGRLIYSTTTQWMKVDTPRFMAGERCQVEFKMNLPLLDGNYDLGVDIAASDLSHFHDRLERALSFYVKGPKSAQGLVDLEAEVAFKKVSTNGAVR